MTYKKKLIEVALPLEAINEGSKPETENPFLKGHPRALHNWWARTPLSVSRAILFAQLIDDPGDGLPPEQARKARERLLAFVAKLATWEATTDTKLVGKAREMISAQFNGDSPEFWDMFAGRGSIPLEAQRLGLKVTSSDLNPVAITIERALLEFPPKFKNRPPVHPEDSRIPLKQEEWKGASGLAEDVRWYGEWVRSRAAQRLAKLYPKGPKGEPIIAWLWARTVSCPNPVCGARAPLIKSFTLSKKRNIHVRPVLDHKKRTLRFEVQIQGVPEQETSNSAGARCIFCKTPISKAQLRELAVRYGTSEVPLAAVCEGVGGLAYLPFEAKDTEKLDRPQVPLLEHPMTNDKRWFSPPLYGLPNFSDLFTTRQLIALTTLGDLIRECRDTIRLSAHGDTSYADAITTYLACALSRLTDYSNTICFWNNTNENIAHLFNRQAIPMSWDFAEANLIYGRLSFSVAADWVAGALRTVPIDVEPARVFQLDARHAIPKFESAPVVSTDPPYYDNIGYADLSDFFYVWLRSLLFPIDSQTFSTVLTPKEAELVASPHRHDGSKEVAERHFRTGFSATCRNLYSVSKKEVPLTIYYAFKQQEDEEDGGSQRRTSTGWETMLEGLLDAGFQITGTWPVRTTKKARLVARNTNALASAIVLVARQRPHAASMATRKEFITALKNELPPALFSLAQTSVAPVDLAQAAIGPGMAVFSMYTKVVEADGSAMRVRTALGLINQVLDEVLTEQDSEYDQPTRWAIAWFEQYGTGGGPFGDAETLSKAKDTAVDALAESGILESGGGKVRLFKTDELDSDWDPAANQRLTIWEVTHHMVRLLNKGGEGRAADLLRKVGSIGEAARDLAYRLYMLCDRKGWGKEALGYNALVVSWPEITRLASSRPGEAQLGLGV